MNPELYKTKNGEFTLYLKDIDETYHSRDGAISESEYVFIEQGLKRIAIDNTAMIKVLEIGFGTGLNALLSARYAHANQREIEYHTIEPYPVPMPIVDLLNYSNDDNEIVFFQRLHEIEWDKEIAVSTFFKIQKIKAKLQELTLPLNHYDLIFFDAFAPRKQSEMWDISIFNQLYSCLKNNGLLTTYSAAGQFKRNLKNCGFNIINPPGANGKREMTIGFKY